MFAFFGRSSSSADESADDGGGDQHGVPAAGVPARRGLSRGTWVRHATLGRGRILSIEGSGDDKRLIVYFQGQGRRKLVAKYAKLEIC